jgi:adenine-specific DNA-methyltransferase
VNQEISGFEDQLQPDVKRKLEELLTLKTRQIEEHKKISPPAVSKPTDGGFRYYSVAPSLLQQDRWGQWVINKEYNAEMLAEAICKLEGFTYAPSDVHYWKHGKSTENDFIYVTTQSLTLEQLHGLSDEVGERATLLVCCSAFRGNSNRFENLTLKKIPKMVLSRCEWAHDDYSLNVENLPQVPKEHSVPQQSGLFDGNAE